MARKKTPVDIASLDRVKLIELANTGKAEALQALEKRYIDTPDLKHRPIIEQWVQATRLGQMFKDSDGTKLCVEQRMTGLKARLSRENQTPLESLLIQRIVMCWLDVQDHELRYSNLGDTTFANYEFRSRMLDRAQKRYLSAVKALAFIRKLEIPAIQVNIGEKQVNVLAQNANVPDRNGGTDRNIIQ